jgi:hypothetical protein
MKNFINKIKAIVIFVSLLSMSQIMGVRIFVTNRIPNIAFKIKVEANEGCGNKSWDSSKLPGGKLTEKQGTAYEILNPCGDYPEDWKYWDYIKLHVYNKNNQDKVINIPVKDDMPPVIIFNKNAAGMVEIHRAFISNIWSFLEDVLVDTLMPQDYE